MPGFVKSANYSGSARIRACVCASAGVGLYVCSNMSNVSVTMRV